MDESIEEDEKEVEDNIGDCDTDEEEDGAVTVLKLSNGVMFRTTWKGPAIYPFICIPFPAVFITSSLRIGGGESGV
jgi:hypothetical protein